LPVSDQISEISCYMPGWSTDRTSEVAVGVCMYVKEEGGRISMSVEPYRSSSRSKWMMIIKVATTGNNDFLVPP